MVAGDKKINLPILHCHGISDIELDLKTILLHYFSYIGNKDPIIQINWARLSEESFKAMGFKQYIFKEYDGMVHTNTEQVRIFYTGNRFSFA